MRKGGRFLIQDRRSLVGRVMLVAVCQSTQHNNAGLPSGGGAGPGCGVGRLMELTTSRLRISWDTLHHGIPSSTYVKPRLSYARWLTCEGNSERWPRRLQDSSHRCASTPPGFCPLYLPGPAVSSTCWTRFQCCSWARVHVSARKISLARPLLVRDNQWVWPAPKSRHLKGSTVLFAGMDLGHSVADYASLGECAGKNRSGPRPHRPHAPGEITSSSSPALLFAGRYVQ